MPNVQAPALKSDIEGHHNSCKVDELINLEIVKVLQVKQKGKSQIILLEIFIHKVNGLKEAQLN